MLRRWCWGIWGLVVVSLNKPGLWQEQPGTDCYCFLRRVGGRWHGGRSVRFHGTFEGSTLCCPLFCCASFSDRSVLCSSSAERRLWYCLCNPPTHCVSRVLYRDLGSCVIWGLVVVSLNKPGLWQPGTDCYDGTCRSKHACDATSGFRTRGLPATALGLTLALSALTSTAAMPSTSEALRAGASSRSFGPVGLGAAAAAGGPTLALAARFTYTSSCIFPVGAVARALPGQASGQLECCDVTDTFLNLPLHPNVWHSCSSSCSLFRFAGAAGSDALQCLMHLSAFRFFVADRTLGTFHLFYVRAVTGLHCIWFNVFDCVGLRSCRCYVGGAGAFGAWLLCL